MVIELMHRMGLSGMRLSFGGNGDSASTRQRNGKSVGPPGVSLEWPDKSNKVVLI
jgi:hypothetical protein